MRVEYLIFVDFISIFQAHTQAKGKECTVKSLLVAAATILFGTFTLRPLFEGGFYLRAATIATNAKIS